MDVIEDTLKSFNGQNGYISYNGLHHQPNGNGSKDEKIIMIEFTSKIEFYGDSCENFEELDVECVCVCV